jgi:DNA invertase Pin-like site-specific DNA recombinase
MINNILVEVMGAIAENEREKILERQKEGIAAMPIVDGKRISVKTGNAMGRPTVTVDGFKEYNEKVQNGEMTVVECCTMLGISRAKWYRMCKEC